ncbi:MAG: ribose transport system ATP-binding protein [Rhodospirillaceae bacterium]|nr:ribose transport system ATP-binding protein [Rhodospirillaceae bacterium]
MPSVPSSPGVPAVDALSIRGLSKSFGATEALRAVDLDLARGEILALLGQNGAGKSTLVKILAGVVRADTGEIQVDGKVCDLERDRQSIAFIHQDLGLIEWMTVAENIALAQGYSRRRGLIDWPAVETAARKSLERIAPGIDPRRRIADLTRTEKSLVAIARALGVDARILVLDEPTASLPQDDVAVLFAVLRDLKRRGVSMIYVSHRLDEVFAISDRLLVLRDGRAVDSRPTRDANPEDLIRAIIGRPPEKVFVRPTAPSAQPVLVCERLRIGAIGPISFTLRRGEILGMVGLRGAGHELISRALVGAEARSAGDVTIKGRRFDSSTVHQAVKGGLGFVAADRLAESIAPGLSIRENMFANPLALGLGLFSWRKPSAEAAVCLETGQRIGLVPNAPDEFIESLSGGNQQKVVLARWMHIAPEVLILEDPTAGVDVGAKAEIYRMLAAELARGHAILLVSTDFEEVAAICHRALVFRDGMIVDELDAADLSTESLTLAASMAPAGSAARRPQLQAS